MPRGAGTAALRFSLRHAGRRRAHRRRCAALPRQLPARDPTRSPNGSRPDAPVEQHDGISIKLSALHPALRGRAARARAGRTGAARVDAVRAGGARQHQSHHRRRGSDRLELSLEVFEALAAQIARQHPQWHGFGLALQAYQTRALELIDACRRASAAQVRPALHGAAGQGRLLGRRDQARAGDGPAALPGVHAQAPHRHLLPGLCPRAAGGAGRDLSAVRHAQRRHHRRDPADGARTRRRSSSCSACTAWAKASIAKC